MIKHFVLAGTLIALFACAPALAAEKFSIAITVDDLTGNGEVPPGTTRLEIAQTFLRALKQSRVPEAYGFVNAVNLQRDPDGAAVLDAWRHASYPLGNHTYSHMNLNDAPTVESWEADVARGEPEIERRMSGANWHYFRYPYLAAGSDQARHDAALTYIKSRGYQVADVSVSFNDWAYSDAYSRCLAKGDNAAVAALKTQYFKGVDDGIERMKTLSKKVYGRMIPQVLLTHLGGFSAATLPETLAKLNAAGASFSTLQQTQHDPAYIEPDPREADGVLMERAAKRKHVDIRDVRELQPIDKLTELCR
jgi:peptidoglycan/xylan/chitin deacetylase (PgdA/CDA1 family)